MSANHARRLRSGEAEVVRLGDRRTRRVARLVAVRDRLARTAAEYSAHDVDGAVGLHRQVHDIEQMIKRESPSLFNRQWSEWVQHDAALIHQGFDSDQVKTCAICCWAANGAAS